MPQAEEGNEEENVEQQGPDYEHHQNFNEEQPAQQPPLYHMPTYTDHHQKDLDSIETQLQNMMWYQQQALENMSKNQAEYMAKLRDIKGKQQELSENNDRFYNQIKNYQVNQTLVDSTRHKAYMDELAAMKAKQEEFFSNQVNQYNMIRQDQKLVGKEILDVKKYQMSAVTMGSGGESYMVWAHQLANPNLVEMSSQKIVKQIYDNIDRKRPMFRGLLKSDLQPPNPAPPISSSKDPQDLASSSKDPENPPK
ncbi:hypothetical protein PIB30_099554 [Stylosanthes scabra]|uniref:Uncharacterized protein n=1 Tax=Stylosanthes scabra TaxID=79078 RepID=A0ABU6ZVI1_9FABA|nr:hypothetical protein [Stylosanthes scabra]